MYKLWPILCSVCVLAAAGTAGAMRDSFPSNQVSIAGDHRIESSDAAGVSQGVTGAATSGEQNEACCIPGAGCIDLTPSQCTAAGGVAQGTGTN